MCSKSRIETLEKGVNYFFLYLYCELLTYFTPFSSIFIADFEQGNVSWVSCRQLVLILSDSN